MLSLSIFFAVMVAYSIAAGASDAWFSKCSDQSLCCKSWYNMVTRSDLALNSVLHSPLRVNGRTQFDLFEPSWSCETLSRVPMIAGNGGKWVCDPSRFTADSLVYSFGSNKNTTFEVAVERLVGSSKNIHVIDDPMRQRGGVGYNKLRKKPGLGVAQAQEGPKKLAHTKRIFSFEDIISSMKEFGDENKTLSILKIDVKGAEHEAFRRALIGDCPDALIKVDELLIEMHVGLAQYIHDRVIPRALFRNLEQCNMRVFSKERNHWDCNGFKCVGFSLVSASSAFDTFKKTHPACMPSVPVIKAPPSKTSRKSSDAWMSKCQDNSQCCTVWTNLVSASDDAYESLLGSAYAQNEVTFFDQIEPVWSCELVSRVPPIGGDGSKFMCDPESLTDSAIVYSFGSDRDVKFEEHVSNFMNSKNNIYVFDPTIPDFVVERQRAKGFEVQRSGLVGRGKTEFKLNETSVFPGKDLIEHVRALGHQNKKLSVLKVDIEGSEYEAFRDIVVGDCGHADVKVDEILIEAHYDESTTALTLFNKFEECNMRVFNKERNHWGCMGSKCVEFSLIGPTRAFESFRKSHPSCDGRG